MTDNTLEMPKSSGPEQTSISYENRILTYIAGPYSHPDLAMRVYRFECLNKLAAEYVRNGHIVYSPISMWHSIALGNDLPRGYEFWGFVDEAMLKMSKLLVVLQLDGWRESR